MIRSILFGNKEGGESPTLSNECLLEVVRAGAEDLLHDATEDGVLHCGKHKSHVVRICSDGDVRVDLGPENIF